jgi:hypothetical protein
MRKIPALVALAALAIASVVSVSAAVADPCPTGNCYSEPCSGGNCDDPPVPEPYPVMRASIGDSIALKVVVPSPRLVPIAVPKAKDRQQRRRCSGPALDECERDRTPDDCLELARPKAELGRAADR